jgi:hypothetical protein
MDNSRLAGMVSRQSLSIMVDSATAAHFSSEVIPGYALMSHRNLLPCSKRRTVYIHTVSLSTNCGLNVPFLSETIVRVHTKLIY